MSLMMMIVWVCINPLTAGADHIRYFNCFFSKLVLPFKHVKVKSHINQQYLKIGNLPFVKSD